jgi:predicted AlkP superfamily phosphohydrolase/phosphomutase
LLIGLDGSSFDLLSPWIEAGELPIFAGILKDGCNGILTSTIPAQTCPALPSLYTGKNPGNTGLFGFVKAGGGISSSFDVEAKPIWQLLSERGLKSGVFNLRTTYPVRPLKGMMFASIQNPKVQPNYAYPKEAKERLSGFITTWAEANRIQSACIKGKRQAVDELLTITEERYHLAKKLLGEEDFDFLLLWIENTDFIQHSCWKHPDLMLHFFQGLEKVLSDLVESYPHENVLICSDHGFGGYRIKDFYINTWLREQGFIKTKGGRFLPHLVSLGYALADRLFNRVFKGVPAIIARAVIRWLLHRVRRLAGFALYLGGGGPQRRESEGGGLRQVLLRRRPFVPGTDWSNSVAYANNSWGVYLNREVVPADRYSETVGEIIRRLKSLRDWEDKPVIKDAWEKSEIYSGRYLDQIPEIVILGSDEYFIRTRPSTKILTKTVTPLEVASHRTARDGLLMAIGPDIKQGHVLEGAKIEDITPTVLHLFGLEVPEDIDGKVLKGIFREGSDPALREVKFVKPGEFEREETRISKEEEAAMKGMLKGLGYLDEETG